MIVLDVVGIPAPQGSKTAYAVEGKNGAKPRAVVREGTSKSGRLAHAAWRDAVAIAAAGVGVRLDEPVALDVEFYMPPTSSDPFRTRHSVTPDCSKLVRCLEDALVAGGLLADDSRICKITATKRYALDRSPGARIEITLLGAAEAEDRAVLKARAAEARRAS